MTSADIDPSARTSADATEVVIARLTAGLMGGQQRVEHDLIEQMTTSARPGIRLRTVEVGGLRSPAPTRAPLRLMGHCGAIDRAAAPWIYGPATLVHRMDARLPAYSREILTLHDACFIRYRDEGRVSRHLARQAAAAEYVVTVSEFSADELRSAWGLRNLVVVPNACAADVAEATPLAAEELASMGIRSPFVLAGGGDTERKNWPMLREVWARFSAHDQLGHQLVLTGADTARKRAIFAGLPRVVHVGFASRSTQLGIMAASSAVLVPSLYEGFGLPIIEAMTIGVPVIAVNRSALPEVAADAAILLEPSPRLWAGALADLLSDEEARRDLVARGRLRAADFSWERSAKQLLDLYENCV